MSAITVNKEQLPKLYVMILYFAHILPLLMVTNLKEVSLFLALQDITFLELIANIVIKDLFVLQDLFQQHLYKTWIIGDMNAQLVIFVILNKVFLK